MQGEWPVLLKIMGKGEGEQPLSQRGRGPDAVRRAAISRTDHRAAESQPAAPQPVRLRKLAKAGGLARRAARSSAIVAIAEFPDQFVTICPPLAQVLPPPLPNLAADQSGLLARAELVAGGPALVPPRQPGHRDFPGALCLVHRAGAAGPSPLHHARHAQGQRLSRTLRLHPEPAVHPYRRRPRCAASATPTSTTTTPAPAVVGLVVRPRLKMSTACRSALRG